MRRLVRRFAWSAGVVLVIAGIAGLTGQLPWPFSSPLGQTQLTASVKSTTWCKPMQVFAPNVGFNPGLATPGELQAAGFPPRPPRSQPGLLRAWLSAISRAHAFVRPDPVCGKRRRGPVYSGNWAGHVVPKRYYGNAAFTGSQSEWVQPAVSADPNYSDYNNAPAVSVWTGVGVAHLMQAGVDSIATAKPTYKFWTEDYPQYMIWEGPTIRPGQVVYVYTKNIGGNQAYYFLENVTTGSYSAFTNALPFVGTDAVNFVVERPAHFYLPSFSSVKVWNNYFWQNDNSYQLTSSNDSWVMTSTCGLAGTLLSRPSEVSGGQFADAWSHSRPFSSSC